MGYSHSNEALDNPQRRYNNELIVKLIENIPQSALMIRESLKNMSTISFFQLASPSVGIFSASFCFSAHVGTAFKTDKEYIFHDDLKAKTLPDKVDNTWLQYFKLFFVNNKNVKPEDY